MKSRISSISKQSYNAKLLTMNNIIGSLTRIPSIAIRNKQTVFNESYEHSSEENQSDDSFTDCKFEAQDQELSMIINHDKHNIPVHRKYKSI